MSDDREESRRQVARREMRTAGYRSTVLANELMKLKDSAIVALDLDEELRAKVERARAVTSMVARRRAERGLAGVLRGVELRDIEIRLANVKATGAAEPEVFHVAEQWRTRFLTEGLAAAATFPGGDAAPLPKLIAAAQRERTTGKPPGAARALFRHITATLKAQRPGAGAPLADAEAVEPDDEAVEPDDEPSADD